MSYENIEQWVYINGNWGDIIVQLQHYASKYKHFGIIISAWGNDSDRKKILEFVNVQSFADKTILDTPLHLLHGKFNTNNLVELCKYYNINTNKVDISYCTSNIYTHFNDMDAPKNIHKLILPYDYLSKNYNITNINKYILINPYSIASAMTQDHWLYWDDILSYLFNMTLHKYILVGKSINHNESFLNTKNIFPIKNYQKYKNVIDLTDNEIIESNCDVLNISNNVAYTITTSNSLSHWCINQNNPCTILSNQGIYFRPWKKIFSNHKSSNVSFYFRHSNLLSVLYNVLNKIN